MSLQIPKTLKKYKSGTERKSRHIKGRTKNPGDTVDTRIAHLHESMIYPCGEFKFFRQWSAPPKQFPPFWHRSWAKTNENLSAKRENLPCVQHWRSEGVGKERSWQLREGRKRSKIIEIVAARDIVFALAQSGVCAAFSRGSISIC